MPAKTNSGGNSVILFSSNSGEGWVKQNTNSSRKLNSVFFINENTGWAAGYRYPDTTNIIKSTNGGASWFNLKNIYSNTLNSIFFINENIGWVSGNGIILKTTSGGLTFMNSIVSQSPERFKLQQNYPNPFNPFTKINFSVPFSGLITLKVFDVSGNEIKTIINEFKNAGSYEVGLDATNLPSGIYFYNLISNKVILTKKMLLLK